MESFFSKGFEALFVAQIETKAKGTGQTKPNADPTLNLT